MYLPFSPHSTFTKLLSIKTGSLKSDSVILFFLPLLSTDSYPQAKQTEVYCAASMLVELKYPARSQY
jgi:hypothetical protein